MSDTEESVKETVMQRYLEREHGGELDDYFKPKEGVYHASTSGSCARRLFFDITHPERPDDGAWKHFELGNRMEEIFEEALIREHGEKYVVNAVPVSIEIDDFEIVGETDPVVIDDNMAIDTLWEVKSTTNLSYVRKQPKWPHVCQVHCYAYGLDLLNEPNARKIVYIDKTSLETVVHDVSFERGIWNHILGKLRTVHQALKDGEAPEVQEEKHRDHFCPHKGSGRCCHDIGNDEEDDDDDSNDGWGR